MIDTSGWTAFSSGARQAGLLTSMLFTSKFRYAVCKVRKISHLQKFAAILTCALKGLSHQIRKALTRFLSKALG
jgi:hypothetical protein